MEGKAQKDTCPGVATFILLRFIQRHIINYLNDKTYVFITSNTLLHQTLPYNMQLQGSTRIRSAIFFFRGLVTSFLHRIVEKTWIVEQLRRSSELACFLACICERGREKAGIQYETLEQTTRICLEENNPSSRNDDQVWLS